MLRGISSFKSAWWESAKYFITYKVLITNAGKQKNRLRTSSEAVGFFSIPSNSIFGIAQTAPEGNIEKLNQVNAQIYAVYRWP